MERLPPIHTLPRRLPGFKKAIVTITLHHLLAPNAHIPPLYHGPHLTPLQAGWVIVLRRPWHAHSSTKPIKLRHNVQMQTDPVIPNSTSSHLENVGRPPGEQVELDVEEERTISNSISTSSGSSATRTSKKPTKNNDMIVVSDVLPVNNMHFFNNISNSNCTLNTTTSNGVPFGAKTDYIKTLNNLSTYKDASYSNYIVATSDTILNPGILK